MRLTENETKVLIAIRDNYYGDGDCTWSWCVDESDSPTGLSASSLPGVIGSLSKKGLVSVEEYENGDTAIWVTDAGKAATPLKAK